MRLGGRLSKNLAELSLKKEEVKTDLPGLQMQTGSDFVPVGSGAQVPWSLGRLFGASKSPNSPPVHTPPTRLARKCNNLFSTCIKAKISITVVFGVN